MKREQMDFITEDAHKRLLFRFYPKSSHMHGFDDEAPADFASVYKVYYSWALFESFPDEGGKHIKVFSMPWDECSCIAGGLLGALRTVMDYKSLDESVWSFGQPGSDWRIWCIRGTDIDNEGLMEVPVPEKDVFILEVFDNSTDKGYRFSLKREDAERFCRYLDDINLHMLENGEPI